MNRGNKTSDVANSVGGNGSSADGTESFLPSASYKDATPVKVSNSGGRSNKSVAALPNFSASFSLENSKYLANEVCRALLELVGASSDIKDEDMDSHKITSKIQLHRDNLFR